MAVRTRNGLTTVHGLRQDSGKPEGDNLSSRIVDFADENAESGVARVDET